MAGLQACPWPTGCPGYRERVLDLETALVETQRQRRKFVCTRCALVMTIPSGARRWLEPAGLR